MAGERDEAALRQYVEDMARLYADWGFPRMAARVLMQLMASDTGYLTAKELSDSLEISPAAVSQSVRYLQHLGLVERSAVPGSRRDRYGLPDDAWYMGSIIKGNLFSAIAKLSENGTAAAGGRATPAGDRIAGMGDFYSFIQSELGSLLERYLKHREAIRQEMRED
ncbi:MarR family transcriptional regulator [Asanoa sp. WMMD1127]|uniref:GbsR/MarR family transcriptional regulator n=1 Tax=Asanoa sp. WMMD1127 TaxID=3016107 RepID=UPI0024169EA8|nr:MarR family transcriptional regulator [Asanoa sp. WMMD1127]MDG4821465.1 MarR family transcriptional regulator [Asanoa sp. WMMD1127]